MTTFRRKRHFGWKRQIPDHRDLKYAAPEPVVQTLEPKWDLRSQADVSPPSRLDQGQASTCVPNEGAFCYFYQQMRAGIATPVLVSRLFVYYYGRQLEGSVSGDDGMEIRDMLKVLNGVGAPPEAEWPYNLSYIDTAPPPSAYSDAGKTKLGGYLAVAQDQQAIKASIREGYPVIGGITVFPALESDEVARTGAIPYPSLGDAPVASHCVSFWGWDDTLPVPVYVMGNTWGEAWGDAGWGTIPQAYVHNPGLAGDLWAMRLNSVTGT